MVYVLLLCEKTLRTNVVLILLEKQTKRKKVGSISKGRGQ